MSVLGRNYSHFDLTNSMLDIQFVKAVEKIEDEYKYAVRAKPDQLRVEQWVKKLCTTECCDKVPLLKNRNRYAKLL